MKTAGKGFTPTQQAWPPLVAEAYAQLETKCAQRRLLGPMRSICWTDHANVTCAQSSDGIEVKLLRWISEILADGSVIRSLPVAEPSWATASAVTRPSATIS